jgi:hypothetical protein
VEGELDPLCWEPEEVQVIENCKESLIMAPVLAESSLEKPFHLFFNADKVAALGVLTQEHRGKKQPVAYFSKVIKTVT